ncbi:uncharacterized protein LOC143864904 [Tasmannia lanceolata]|uniref:uncharacterized protein LOC143864904 n=1 Tax=Tasmannia lanceolata TaxID=3420 RepID=UPI0040648D8C
MVNLRALQNEFAEASLVASNREEGIQGEVCLTGGSPGQLLLQSVVENDVIPSSKVSSGNCVQMVQREGIGGKDNRGHEESYWSENRRNNLALVITQEEDPKPISWVDPKAQILEVFVNHIISTSRALGLTYSGSEDELINLFRVAEGRELDQRMLSDPSSLEGIKKMLRELAKLKSDVNYDGSNSRIPKSSNRKSSRRGGPRGPVALQSVGEPILVTYTGIYGPTVRNDKVHLWEELAVVRNKWGHPWCLGGDFNEVRWVEERMGCRRSNQSMSEFSEFIARHELIDIPLSRAKFTWSRNSRKSRIDRFLFCSEWASIFPLSYQKALIHSVSDHCPLLLDPRLDSWGPSPFRFDLAWLEIPKMEELMGEWWVSHKVEGAADFVIGEKLRAVKKKLKEWNSNRLGERSERTVWLLDRIRAISFADEEGNALEEELLELGRYKEEHRCLLLQDEISWRQKSRALWLKEGDKNTAYFHSIASARRRTNHIAALEVGGVPSFSREAITKEIVDFFRLLYSSEVFVRPVLDDVHFKVLDENSRLALERPFSEEEVEVGVFSMDRNKAPGPDGFCMAFFQSCWEYVKGDIFKFFKDFYEGMELDRGTGASFIALLPKIKSAVKVSDFRPISLVGCLYKVLSKVLGDRLKVVLPMIISTNQCAFVSQQQILDCSLVANETVDWLVKTGSAGVVCKLDMEKAYDRVEWHCLDHFLGKMGFGNRWRGWIKSCLSSAWFSILINGSPKGFFRSSRGLRQGDPLSPFLFVIVAEALSLLMEKGKSVGLVKGIQCGQNRVEVSHLQFADDTLLFSSPQTSKILNLKAVLRCYEIVTGQRSNFSKSCMYTVNVGEEEAKNLANLMGCLLDRFPSSYLGLPLGGGRQKIGSWAPIVERIERRLDTWKRNLVSKGGRLTLIKAVLPNIPIYHLSLFKCPISIAKRIELIQRRFPWGGSKETRSFSLVSWEDVCKPVLGGGLGIRKIKQVNAALMGKWLWRYGEEQSQLWAKVIRGKYGSDVGNWRSLNRFNKTGVTLWRDILRLSPCFDRGIRYRVYSGDRISFWNMVWCSIIPLKELFPDLYVVAVDKQALVNECFEIRDKKVIWKPLFRRNFFDRELLSLVSLLQVLEGNDISSTEVDKRLWVWDSSGQFSGKEYDHSQSLRYVYRRGGIGGSSIYSLQSSSRGLGKSTVEIWYRVGIPFQSEGSFEGWVFIPWRKKGKVLWSISLLATMWVLWSERNNRIFVGRANSTYYLYIKAIALSISWARSLPMFKFVSAFDMWAGWKVVCNSQVPVPRISQKWANPPVGFSKLNFDGSSLGNPGPAGIGGVVMNSDGEVVQAYSGPIGVADSNEAEVRAAYQGILLLGSERVANTIVEGDSLNVIRWLKGSAVPPWRFLHFFDEIKDITVGRSVAFQNVRRAANEVADKLAKAGAVKQSLELYDFLPP